MRHCVKYLTGLLVLLFLCLPNFSYAVYPPPVVAKKGMVVSVHYLASQVGVDILKQGGNAVDAAVAVGYALAVVYPSAGNLGGGGFMLIHFANGKDVFLNFREKAPLAAHKDMFLDKNGNVIPNSNYVGYLAAAVPGTVMGLNTALQKYGTMSLQQVMAPAIKLAQQGFRLTPSDANFIADASKDFSSQPNITAIFFKKNGELYQPGDLLVQTNLANTLKLIATGGTDAFYHGSIADRLVAASQKHGGIFTKDDFTHYTVQELTPVYCNYRGYHIISSPPPSSGGTTLCEIINIVEAYPLAQWGFHSAQSLHYLIEAMRYAYYDRNNNLGDPDFVKNPVAKLTSKAYAAQIRNKIQTAHANSSSLLTGSMLHEGTNTTHYSVVDAAGNAVSLTYTLNNTFGARVMAKDTGFFLNDEMDDFSIKAGEPNAFGLVQGKNADIMPGKRPLSSMTPTIVTKNNKTFMILGSPAGSAIITSVLQTILNVVDYGMDIKSAVDSPRIHFQWLPDVVLAEPYSLSQDTQEKLTTMGYQFQTPDNLIGDVQAILIDPRDHRLYGGSDNRIPSGQAIGY